MMVSLQHTCSLASIDAWVKTLQGLISNENGVLNTIRTLCVHTAYHANHGERGD